MDVNFWQIWQGTPFEWTAVFATSIVIVGYIIWRIRHRKQ